MNRKTAQSKRNRNIRILDKASVVVGVVALVIGTARKIISNKNKSK